MVLDINIVVVVGLKWRTRSRTTAGHERVQSCGKKCDNVIVYFRRGLIFFLHVDVKQSTIHSFNQSALEVVARNLTVWLFTLGVDLISSL